MNPVQHERHTSKQSDRETGDIVRRRQAASADPALHPVQQLQQQAGNQAVQELLRSGVIQARLAISNPSDPAEEEADRVADYVMSAHEGQALGAHCPCMASGGELCEDCKQKQAAIHRRAAGTAAPSTVPPIVGDVLRSPGHPLDAATRAFMEPRFGRDFSNVRIHTGPAAADSACSINALAYTLGSNVVFAPGRYNPHSSVGRSLLAHELTHTIQQGSALDPSRSAEARVQRQHDPAASTMPETAALDEQYQTALAESRRTGNWQKTAELLNGFSHDDIQDRLANLTTDEINYLHLGALDNSRVGPQSQIAQMTAPAKPPVQPGTGAPCAVKPVPEMSNTEKLSCAIDYARAGRDAAMAAQLEGLKTPQSIFAMVALAALYAGAQFTPVGWVADAFLLAAISISGFFGGALIGHALVDVATFVNAINASTQDDLKRSGEALADAVALGGITLIMALIFHAGREAPPGRTAFDLSDTQNSKVGVTPDGQLVRIPKETPDSPSVHMSEQNSTEPPGGNQTHYGPPHDQTLPDEPPDYDPDEPGRMKELESKDPRETNAERLMRGNDLDSAYGHDYPIEQVELENGTRLDGYDPGREIVSRKHTQLSKLSESTREGYVNELLDKYGKGNKIKNTPKARKLFPQLIGKPLQGKYILEVPYQENPLPEGFGEWARRWDVTIRDVHGTIYN